MERKGISIIICCYNSASRIVKTLEHIAAQEVSDDLLWEVILVNNASTDNTKAVAHAELIGHPLLNTRFKIIDEPAPGLSNAREKGIQNALFDYIIFCDDDNWLDAAYVNVAYNIISANSGVAALGGQSTAVSDTPLPSWFNNAAANYAVGKQAENTGDVSSRKFLWGSGIVIKKVLYQSAFAGFPSLLTGRKGEELTSGEDSEMCMRFLLMGYQLFYSENLLFKHFVAPERLTEDYNERLVQGFIKAHETLKIYASFIDTEHFQFKKKCTLLVQSLLRIIVAGFTGIKRWNITTEKLNIYVIARIPFSAIEEKYILIGQFIKRSRTNGYHYR